MVEKLIKFTHKLSKLKHLIRFSNNDLVTKKDTVASHTWRAMIIALFIDDIAKTKIDSNKVLKMLLIHDLVEFDNDEVKAVGNRNQKLKEDADNSDDLNLFKLLNDKQHKKIKILWNEFQSQKTIESKIAKAIENYESNMTAIENVEAIKNNKHREITKNYIKRRLGIDNGLDKLIKLQLDEIERIE